MTDKKEENIFEKLVVEDPNLPNHKWYLVQTHSNAEKAASNNIRAVIELNKLEEHVKEVVVPAVEVTELKAGKKKKVMKKLYPGYILIFAEMTDVVCSTVTSANKVFTFLNKTSESLLPRPVSKHEIKAMIEQLKGYSEDKASLLEVKEGSRVRIKVDPFDGNYGIVDEINIDNGTAKVLITILGREVEFKVGLNDIEIAQEE